MPTENRSSNTEMVSFPRELSDDLAELIATRARVCGGGAFEIWEAICEGFGKPAEQNYGEPVAWCQPHWSGKYADYSWGAERPNAAFPELWKPLYTNADPGEVERLRDLLSEVLNEVPHGWGASFSESELAGRIRDALEVES
ncbi:hypothetical protein [Pseudomonas soli]|uniref:hypothetical protein n=1 Tax=Pseudomonas soli TaxID=1306993 RepID=UPI00056F84CC